MSVVCDPGGGAPTLDINRIRRDVFGGSGSPIGRPMSVAHDAGCGVHRVVPPLQNDELAETTARAVCQQDSEEARGQLRPKVPHELVLHGKVEDQLSDLGQGLPGGGSILELGVNLGSLQASAEDTRGLEGRPDNGRGTAAPSLGGMGGGIKRLAEGAAGQSTEEASESQELEEDGCLVHSPLAGVIEGADGCSENGMELDAMEASEGRADAPNSCPMDGCSPLLLLIPLTLGMGKVDPAYLPQIQRVLTFPQSVGIVGGRPGASLYFVGHQV